VVSQLQPDIVLRDIRLPDQSAIAACQQVRQRWPAVQVLMLTSFADEELVLEAIGAGAAGYVLKQIGNDNLLRAVRAGGRGDAALDPAVTRQLLARVRAQSTRPTAPRFTSFRSASSACWHSWPKARPTPRSPGR
jgi:two-component system, NarL family, response regulator DevR